MSVGAELAAARRKLGLSIEEVAAKTNITRERLNAIEEMGGEWLPSAGHLQDFVYAYAVELRLDAIALAQRYLVELDVAPTLTVAMPARSAAPAAPSDNSGLDEFSSESGAADDELFASESATPAPQTVADDRDKADIAPITESDILPLNQPDIKPILEPDVAPDTEPGISPLDEHDETPLQRTVAPIDDDGDILPLYDRHVAAIDDDYVAPVSRELLSAPAEPPRRFATVVVVAAIAVLAGWLLSSNLDRFSGRSTAATAQRDAQDDKATAISDARGAAAIEQAAPAVPARSNAPAPGTEVAPSTSTSATSDARRRPDAEPTPALANAPTAPAAAPATSPATKPAPAPLDSRSARTTAPATGSPAEPLGARAIAQTAPASERTTNAERAADTTNRDTPNGDSTQNSGTKNDATQDVSGWWAVTNRVESASIDAFENLNLGFHLQLQQRGNRVTGTGEKWMENGRRIPAGSRTRIDVEGTLTGQRLELSFIEHGTQRTSNGSFVLRVSDEGILRGTFASDAANAQGTSLARRMESPPR